MKKDEIMAKLEELGVEFDKSAKKAELELLLAEAQEGGEAPEEVVEQPEAEETTEEVVEEQPEEEVQEEEVVEEAPEEEEPESGEHVLLSRIKMNGNIHEKGEKIMLPANLVKDFREQKLIK